MKTPDHSGLLTCVCGATAAILFGALGLTVPELGASVGILALAAGSAIAGGIGLGQCLSSNSDPEPAEMPDRTINTTICNGPCREDHLERVLAARCIESGRER